MVHSRYLLPSLLLLAVSCGGKQVETQAKAQDINDLFLAALEERPSNPSCLAFPRPQEDTNVRLQRIGNQSFREIVGLYQHSISKRFYAIRRTGQIETFTSDFQSRSMFLDMSTVVNSRPGEGGLLGMAWHPSRSNEFYLSYTVTSGQSPANLRSVIARFRTDNGLTASFNPEIILTLEQPYDNHNGGHIAFGPDGYLYIGFGDGGSWGDPQNLAQNPATFHGKMLRIDVDQAQTYQVPADNPFLGQTNYLPEIYATGLRNPWRFQFDRATGDLWLGDVGQDLYEEINLIQKGGNYGWKYKEGFSCYNRPTCNQPNLIDPVIAYGRADGGSVTGGFVYRGESIPSLQGVYLYGDFMSGRVWGLFPNESGSLQPRLLLSTGMNISSFAEDDNGELYILDYVSGNIHRLVPQTDSRPVARAPSKLSETGCFEPEMIATPMPGLIPYEVNSPLWSDGSAKRRWMALPDSGKITIADDGKFEFPRGTVLIKEFSLSDRPIETRLFILHVDGVWAGYTYAWADDGSDAELVLNGSVKHFDGLAWSYPSQAQCLQCHNPNAGFVLGLEVSQLDRLIDSGEQQWSQLDGLEKLDLFTQPLTLERNPLPEPSDTIDAALAARSYIHSNCAFCHRPGGTGGGNLDFRYTTELAATGLCRTPSSGNLGIEDARLIFPGNPEKSVLLARISKRGIQQMPPLASNLVDTEAQSWIEQWISELEECPSIDNDPIQAGAVISLRSRHSGKCLDLDNGNSANGANIHQWTCDGGNNQKFRIERVSASSFQLENAGTGKCIDVAGRSAANGANVQQWDCSSGANQRISLHPAREGSYQVRFEHSGKCLDVAELNLDNRANIHQWDCVGSANQEWFITID